MDAESRQDFDEALDGILHADEIAAEEKANRRAVVMAAMQG